MRKKDFRKVGINEEYLSQILERRVSDFDVEEVKKGAHLRADLYKFVITYESKESASLFVKDYWYSTNIAKNVATSLVLNENSPVLDKNELDFLVFGTKNGAFVPKYYGYKEYENGETGKHSVVFMEHWDKSLEERLLEIGNQIKQTSQEEEKRNLENLAFEYIRRAVDVALINNNLATQNYKKLDSAGLLTVYKLEEDRLKRELKTYLEGFVRFKIRNENFQNALTKLLELYTEHSYRNIFTSLVDFVIKPLVSNPNERGLVNWDLHPGNVLIREGDLSPYDPDAIILFKDGKKSINTDQISLYNKFSITDNNKIGYGSNAIIASLTNHISIFRILSKERQRQLFEHILVQQEKLKQGRVVHLEDIDFKKRKDFDDEYVAAARLANLRGMSFVSWLNLKHPERAKELEEQLPIYNPDRFVKATVEHFVNLEHSKDYFKEVNAFLEDLTI